MRPTVALVLSIALSTHVLTSGGCARVAPAPVPGRAEGPRPSISAEDDALLEDLSKRSFLFFWEQADPDTGIVRDRARTDGTPVPGTARDVGSIASVGFGVSGLCLAAERGWVPRRAAVDRARTTLRFFAQRIENQRGWFYHFINLRTGAREWASELSSIDTALLLAGVMTVRQCFADEADIARLADLIYRRVDFTWMLAGDPLLLSHGWKPETGFLESRWDHYCELTILYLLAVGSPTHPIPAASWQAWRRPVVTFDGHSFIGGPPPLFVHQFSHAWVDFRGWREREPPAHRLVDELRRGDPRTQGLLSDAGGRVSGVHGTRLGHHLLRQPARVRGLGRAAAPRGHRRHGGAMRGGGLADAGAGYHHARRA